MGLVEIEDAETGERRMLDTSSPAVRSRYRNAWAERAAAFQSFCSGAGIDHIPITVGEDYVRPLVRFFSARERRL